MITGTPITTSAYLGNSGLILMVGANNDCSALPATWVPVDWAIEGSQGPPGSPAQLAYTNGGSVEFDDTEQGVFKTLASLKIDAPSAGLLLLQATGTSLSIREGAGEIGFGFDSTSFISSVILQQLPSPGQVPSDSSTYALSYVIPIDIGVYDVFLNTVLGFKPDGTEWKLKSQLFQAMFFPGP